MGRSPLARVREEEGSAVFFLAESSDDSLTFVRIGEPGNEGHGVNSYALAVNMKIGPIHVLLKNYMGGWYGDRSQENEKWNTLVDSMEPLFSELSRPHFSHTEESTKIWIHNQELFEYVDGVYTLESFKSFDEAMRYALARISA